MAEGEYPSDGTTSGYRRRFSDDQWHAPYVYRSGASIMPLRRVSACKSEPELVDLLPHYRRFVIVRQVPITLSICVPVFVELSRG